MPDPLIPNMLRVQCSGVLGGSEEWANVFHVVRQVDSVFLNLNLTLAEANIVADPFRDFYDAFDTSLANNWALTRITVSEKFNSPGASFEAVTVPALPLLGLSATDALPYQTALVITWKTAVNSRSGRGRTFLAGFAEGQNTEAVTGDPTLAAANVTDITNAAQGLGTQLQGINYDLVVFQRKAPGVARIVTSLRVGNVFDTQRRRRNKIGEQYSSATIP